MARLFADLPEAIAHTLEISSRLQFTLADLGYQFPRYPVPEGETQISFLRKRVDEGARRRYQPYHERARRQIERELALIEKLKTSRLFPDRLGHCALLAKRTPSWRRDAARPPIAPCATRSKSPPSTPWAWTCSSSASFPKSAASGPTSISTSPAAKKRERVIQYVYRRFGKLGAAMTANVITYRGRSAAREVGKALGFEVAALDRLTGQSQDAGPDLNHPRVRKFFELIPHGARPAAPPGQHSAAWWSARGSSIPWSRSNPPPCPAAWWCSGTRKTAPIWNHQGGTCSAWHDGGH